MVNTAELRQIFRLRDNTLRHVVEGDGHYPSSMTLSDGATKSYMPGVILKWYIMVWNHFLMKQ